MTPGDDDGILRRYLLCRLTPEAREKVEARIFSDDRVFWERLTLDEDQLVDDYVGDRLDADARWDFERHFLCTEERRAKVDFVRALRAHLERPQRPARAWDFLRRPAAMPRWAMAIAATSLLAVPAVLWQTAGVRVSQTDVQAWLPPGLIRASGDISRVQVTDACATIHLHLDPGPKPYPAYRVTLHEVSGEELLAQSRLTVAALEGRPAVTMTLPCQLLPEGDYFVRLHGLAAGTEPVALQRYEVRVLRQ
jgi:hypothetical protein